MCRGKVFSRDDFETLPIKTNVPTQTMIFRRVFPNREFFWSKIGKIQAKLKSYKLIKKPISAIFCRNLNWSGKERPIQVSSIFLRLICVVDLFNIFLPLPHWAPLSRNSDFRILTPLWTVHSPMAHWPNGKCESFLQSSVGFRSSQYELLLHKIESTLSLSLTI